MRKTARRLILGATIAALAICAVVGGVYVALRQPPKFYREALAASPTANADKLERQALELHNRLRHSGRWELRLSQDDINGWLATELNTKLPAALPPGISDPRVAIEGNQFQLAVRYQREGIDTVVSLACEAWVTNQPNEVAIRLASARAGLVPIPLARFLAEISQRADRAGIPLRWTEVKGAPTAVVRLQLSESKDAESPRRIVVDQLALADHQLVVAGATFATDQPPAEVPATASQSLPSETRQR